MKKLIIAASILLVSCEEIPKYKYAIDIYVPDSTRVKQRAWAIDAIEAACFGSAGDGEFEDAIYEGVSKSESMFQVRGEGLMIIKDGFNYYEFVPKERLTKEELSIFNSLKPKAK